MYRTNVAASMSVVIVEYGDEKMRRKFDYYIASPYSHPSSAVRERRFQDVAKFAAYMVRKGSTIFCPITHSHPIQEHGTPGGWEFWKEIDETAIDNCRILYVLCIEGWNESEGVEAEIEYAKKRNMFVRYVTEVDGEYKLSNCPPPFDYQKAYREMQKKLEKRLGYRWKEAHFEELVPKPDRRYEKLRARVKGLIEYYDTDEERKRIREKLQEIL